ncbi:MAG: hypothetical protein NUV56_01100 [Candidatus Uhrbacteria bacterium]|nr:hypothetical protein [Candidatus Uhrbacteria bacterium]
MRFIDRFKNPKVVNILTIGCILAFGILYIGQVNSAATRGYAIRDLERGNEDLRHDRERLDVEIARLRSLDSVTTREQFLGLVKVQKTEYLVVGKDVVALK